MEILLKYEDMDLIDFMKDENFHQKVITLPITTGTGYKKCLATKLNCCNNVIILSVYDIREYAENSSDILLSTVYNRQSYIIAYDNLNNIAILTDSSNINYTKLKATLGGYYSVYEARELADEINNKYTREIEKILNSRFNEYMRNIPEYKNHYQDKLKDRLYVEAFYIANKNAEFHLRTLRAPGYNLCEIYKLHSYLLNKDVIHLLAHDYVREYGNYFMYGDTLCKHAEIMAYNTILKDVKLHPSDRLKKINTILEAISKGGKTLSIITRTGEKYKVDNRLVDLNKYFITVTGYITIPIDNVTKITFNRKTLYEAIPDSISM